MTGFIFTTIGIFIGYWISKFVNMPEISQEEIHRMAYDSGFGMGKLRGRIEANGEAMNKRYEELPNQ